MTEARRLLGVVMDPIETIKPKKDSTLAMLLAAQRAGWSIVYLRQQDLMVRDGAPLGRGGATSRSATTRHDWFELGGSWSGGLEQLDVLLMRKDPPFDMEYIYTTYILELAEQPGVLVVNKPASLRDINEKAYTAWFPQCTPPSLVTRSRSELLEFLAEHGKIVLKPLDGMGGRSIFVVRRGDLNANVIIETLTDDGAKFTLAQRYVPEIVHGDKRDSPDRRRAHRLCARAYSGARRKPRQPRHGRQGRRPAADGSRPMARRPRSGPMLPAKGVMFAGLDVIGDYLTEINVTSPTGIRELDRQYGIDIAAKLIAAMAGNSRPGARAKRPPLTAVGQAFRCGPQPIDADGI